MAEHFFLNGEQHVLTVSTIDALLLAKGIDAANGGVAVARNGEVVPRGDWAQTPVDADDRIEFVHIVRGG
jgi:sulfur carrier protein